MSEISTGPAAVRTIRIIWMAILFSLFIYALMGFRVLKQPADAPLQSHFSNRLVLILHVAGFGTFMMAMVMSSMLLRGSMNPDARAGSAPHVPPGAVVVTGRTRLALIVRWAMVESSAIFGLIAAFVAQDPKVFLPLGALAAIGILLSYPSDDRLREMAAQSA